jgi:hypothetical protein
VKLISCDEALMQNLRWIARVKRLCAAGFWSIHQSDIINADEFIFHQVKRSLEGEIMAVVNLGILI